MNRRNLLKTFSFLIPFGLFGYSFNKEKFKIGDKVKDIITGETGIVVKEWENLTTSRNFGNVVLIDQGKFNNDMKCYILLRKVNLIKI